MYAPCLKFHPAMKAAHLCPTASVWVEVGPHAVQIEKIGREPDGGRFYVAPSWSVIYDRMLEANDLPDETLRARWFARRSSPMAFRELELAPAMLMIWNDPTAVVLIRFGFTDLEILDVCHRPGGVAFVVDAQLGEALLQRTARSGFAPEIDTMGFGPMTVGETLQGVAVGN